MPEKPSDKSLEKTPELKVLLVDELQDLLNAGKQIVAALPKMVAAAHNNKLEGLLKSIFCRPKAMWIG